MSAAGVDLLDPAVVADPYPHFARLREAAPVHRDEALGAWVITRYDDVRDAFRDPRMSADRLRGFFERRLAEPGGEAHRPTWEILSRWLVFNDPPAHARLRRLVEHAFRPRAIERMRAQVHGIVDELAAGLEGAARVDFVEAFAYPLPMRVVSDMIGVPEHARGEVKRCSDDIATIIFGALDAPDRHARAGRGIEAFTAMLRELVRERRARRPDATGNDTGERAGADLLSDLVEAHDRGDALDEAEIVATCVLLLFAGHETTTNLLANGLKALLEHPEELARLRAAPALLPSAIEEILRFDGPSKAMWRLAGEDAEYGGERIRAGERVLLLQAAANRDPRRFERADAFDVARSPNRHVGFGYAAHYCLGASIARLEGTLGLGAIVERFPGIRLADEPHAWKPMLISRSLEALPVIL